MSRRCQQLPLLPYLFRLRPGCSLLQACSRQGHQHEQQPMACFQGVRRRASVKMLFHLVLQVDSVLPVEPHQQEAASFVDFAL